jgi:cytochrome bd ubiquinol oxidase subunit I
VAPDPDRPPDTAAGNTIGSMLTLSLASWLSGAGIGADRIPQLLPARIQMAFTLGFHIILVPFGVAFTFLMMLANYRGLRRNDQDAMRLAERWSKVAAVLFAVGAVSGTVLTFELGLLWPGLMGRFGAAYGIPFAVEGIFFFLEAIFLAIYIYGWKRLSPWAHFWSGLPVVIAGAGGTASVVAANGWMNLPGGFTLQGNRIVDVHPLAVFFNRAFWYEALHMFLAAYIVAGFVVAAVYAVGMLRGRRDRYQRLGFLIAFTVAAVVIPVQILVGDLVAREVFRKEPAKFAVMEMVPTTHSHVAESVGGVLHDGEVRYAIRIPTLTSLLAGYSPATTIRGLNEIAPAFRPEDRLVTTVHWSFDIMVFSGFALLGMAMWFGVAWWRRRDLPRSRWFLRAAAASGVLSVVSLEAGWVVTEVGRQPWTVVGYLLTRDAVTRSGNVWWFFAGALAIYVTVGIGTVYVLLAMLRRWRALEGKDVSVPYGPEAPLESSVPKVPPA